MVQPDKLIGYVDQGYWDTSYSSYEFKIAPPKDSLRKWLEKNIPRGYGQCFEIGCYPGRYLALLGSLGYELNGLDKTRHVRRGLSGWLSQSGYRVGKIIQGDIFTYQDSIQYDLVCSFGFIEHFDNWQDVVLTQAELVRPGGTVVITTPNFRGFFQKNFHLLFDEENLLRHNLSAMDPVLWMEILKKKKFESFKLEYFGGFEFWVDPKKNRGWLEKKILRLLLSSTNLFNKVLPSHSWLYSPHCGLIAVKGV